MDPPFGVRSPYSFQIAPLVGKITKQIFIWCGKRGTPVDNLNLLSGLLGEEESGNLFLLKENYGQVTNAQEMN